MQSETNNDTTTSYGYNTDGSIKSEQIGNAAKINYSYKNGCLIQRGSLTYEYDNLGNCTDYAGVSLDWYRGNMLRRYGSGADSTSYNYDNQGVRFAKTSGGITTRYYHDGGKMIDEVRGGIRIRYLYDAEEMIGFKVGSDYYYFIKDALGNVRKVIKAEWVQEEHLSQYYLKEVASYDYDAWGNCTATAVDGYNIGGISVAEYNPIRWKSQYYDRESGFYYIGGGYYSPETKQYISAANVETVLANATTVYGLNLYSLTLTNPLDFGGSRYTIATNSELTYDPPHKSALEMFWASREGKTVAIVLIVVASLLCGATLGIGSAFVSLGLTAAGLIVGGCIAGYQSYVNGKGFWRGYER